MINRVYTYLAAAATLLIVGFMLFRGGRNAKEREILQERYESARKTIKRERMVRDSVTADPDGMRRRLSDALRDPDHSPTDRPD